MTYCVAMRLADGLVFASVAALVIGYLNNLGGEPGEGLLAW